jgi:hypothetical protein
MELVRNNGYALKYVKKQTPEICMEAVKQKMVAIKYVRSRIILRMFRKHKNFVYRK